MSQETTDDRINRLLCGPNSADLSDVAWLVEQYVEMRRRLLIALKADGRFYGLREAAGLIDQAATRDVKVRFMSGKKEQASRAINTKLLTNVANLIRRYAEEQEAGPKPQDGPATVAA